jgi:hypothetical protein
MAKRIKDGNQALALLMSVPNLDERRNLVAEDVEGDRSFSAINPLSLALVLAAPFGVSREWRSLCRRRPVGGLTNQRIIAELMAGLGYCDVMMRLKEVMPRFRLKVLSERLEAFEKDRSVGLAFEFIPKEIEEAGAVIALRLGHEIGGEVFWSYDVLETKSGCTLPFIFQMISRKQLSGCVSGPYDDEDPDPRFRGLQDLYHWERE